MFRTVQCGTQVFSIVPVEFSDSRGDELIPKLLTIGEVSDCLTGPAEPLLSRFCVKWNSDCLAYSSTHQK
jgi:hypothetical protein